jgi:uncharacterized membrane protein
MEHFEKELKKEFQIERMILFSDAVFAIAITLLVIEIKVPHIESNISDEEVLNELLHLLPKFFGFIVSFFIIGIYWTVHHRIFGHLVNYDNKLIWLNIFYLFGIVLIPFSASLYSEFYQPNLHVPYNIYTLNVCLIAWANYLLFKHIRNPKAKISVGFNDKNEVKAGVARTFMMPILFIFGAIISYIFPPWIGRFMPMFVPLYLSVVNRIYKIKN